MPDRRFDRTLPKFIVVGLINTIVGTAIMFGCYNLLGLSYWFSSAANYLLTSILSFFLNRRFTFEVKAHSWGQAIKFALNVALCYVIAYGIAKPAVYRLLLGADTVTQENLAMAVGMCLFTALNYIGQRFFIFKKASEEQCTP